MGLLLSNHKYILKSDPKSWREYINKSAKKGYKETIVSQLIVGLPGFGPGSPTPEAGRIPNYPTDPFEGYFSV